MELNVTISALALLVIALASIGGGLVLYRGSRRVGWKAVGMSAVALGAGVLLVFTLTFPVSTEGEPAEPVIGRAPIPAQSIEPPTTKQQPSESVSTVSMIAPNLRLTFEGMEYTGVEVLTAASPTGPIMCCGSPINMDDMEVVGTGANHIPNGDASVEVYRPKAGATTAVYTFHPAQTVEASGESGGSDTGTATWFRWTADVAPPAPLSYEQWCRKWTPGEDCSPSLSLTDQDRSELIRQTLERALIGNEMLAAEVLVKDNESVVLSTENINASLVTNIPNRNLILLRPEEIQKKADDQGDFMFLSFNLIEVRGSVVHVWLANTLAKGKDSE